jgi:hypothetical protein
LEGLPSAKGRQFFLLAFIASMLASAATITTRHHHQNPSTGKIQKFFVWVIGRHFALTVLRILCILVQNSLSSMFTDRMATPYDTLSTKVSRVSQPMYFGWQMDYNPINLRYSIRTNL